MINKTSRIIHLVFWSSCVFERDKAREIWEIWGIIVRTNVLIIWIFLPKWTYSKGNLRLKCTRDLENDHWPLPLQQVVLPLLEQYVKSHRLYFLSISLCSNVNRSHASKKEKEMISRYVSHSTKHTANSTSTILKMYSSLAHNFVMGQFLLICFA